jgi:class 3 adenylate cyclase
MNRLVARLGELAPRFFAPLVWAVTAATCFSFAAVIALPGRNFVAELVALCTMLLAIAASTYAYLVVLDPPALRRLLRAREAEEPEEPAPEPPQIAPALQKYFGPQVSRVLSEQGPQALSPQRREITVLFADLSGFTRYSEVVSAEEAVATLTHYLDELVRLANVHGGTVDKFMGDEIMVLFGAPVAQADHAPRAVACARDMQVVVSLVNAERARRGLPTLGLTVGVNSGECVVGHVGGEDRVQFSAIGDAVNVAKRIQGLATRGDIVVGERTLELAGLPCDSLEEHFVKGRGRAVRMRRIGTPEEPTRI